MKNDIVVDHNTLDTSMVLLPSYPLNGKTLQANLPAILPEFWLSFTFAKNKATLIKMFS